MKRILFVLISMLLLKAASLPAQNTALLDSTNARIEQAEKLKFTNPEQSLQLGQAALALAKTNTFTFQEGKAYQIISRVYAIQGNYTAALEANQAALSIYQQLDKPREICLMYIARGIIYRFLQLYDESIAANLEAGKLAQQHNYEDLKAAVYGNMGNVYFDKKEYEQALASHLKSLEIDKARNHELGMGNTYHNLGMIYRAKGELGKAFGYYEKSIGIDRKNNNHENIALSYLEFTEMYMEIGSFKEALAYADSTIKIAEAIGSKRFKKNALSNLPLIYAALGQKKKALAYQQEYMQLSDSLQSENLSEQIAEMQARYQAEQKDKELSLQNLRLQAQQASLSQQRTLIIGLIAFLLSAGLIGFLLFNRYKLQQKNLKLSLENEQFRLTRDLRLRENIDDIIQYFANSLYGKNTVDEILWDIAKNCISRLGFVDCVIYLLDEQQNVLVQKAAFGTKNPAEYAILEPFIIPLGKGIVGNVALSGKAEIVNDTSLDARYLLDDQQRFSELAVPIFFQNKVIGIIDSEHPDKSFFQDNHLEALQTIAAICSSKIAKARADEAAEKARLMQLEADHIKKLDQIKSQFFANISHEFRTPLHLILAPLQKKGEEISSQEMNMMQRNANRLLRLVNQLLDLAKAEVGMLKLNVQQADLFQLLHNIAHSFQVLAERKSIHFHIHIPATSLMAGFDADVLEKIVYNLLSNAIKFTPSGEEVKVIAAVEPDHMLRIEVSDTGPGIPEFLQTKVFERFFQVDGSQTRAFEGTGIGLALTRELVELYKGSIILHSQVGKGSTFVVRIPLIFAGQKYETLPDRETMASFHTMEPDLEPEAINDSTVLTSGKPAILLVEDHPELRQHLKKQLSAQYQVIAATQGDEGLRLARKFIPDLIITDIMMPVMDGVTLTRHLKDDNLTSHIPVIMLTAKDDVASKTAGFEKGAEQYLVKPFIIDELLARINSLLTQRERLRKKYSREVLLQPASTTVPDREAEFLEKIIRIIDEHIMDENFSVEILQREIGMSRMQLHRKLTALTGQPASDFIRSIRLKRAADLLQQPGIQIAEAAYMSGFSHMSYFSKSFKEQFGVLPSEYAKQSN